MLDTGPRAPAYGMTWHRIWRCDIVSTSSICPGTAGSRPWAGRLDDAFYRGFIRELLDELGLDRVGLIGLSMGGGVAVGFALEHPDRVSALVPIGPGGIGAQRPYQFLTWATMRTPRSAATGQLDTGAVSGYVRSSMAAGLTAGVETPGFERIIAQARTEAREKNRHGEKVLDDWQIEA